MIDQPQRANVELNAPKSPRLRYLAVALLMMLLIQLFAVVVSGISARNNSIAVAEDGIGREGDTTIESILRHLEPAEQSVEVTARLLSGNLLDTSRRTIQGYLVTQLSVMPQVTGAFIGYPDGGFEFVSLDDDGYHSKQITVEGERTVVVEHFNNNFERQSGEEVPDDTYDPRTRPWYQLATESDAVEWTDPYVFFTSGKPGVTVSRAVVVDGAVTAVVGVDVELSGLATFLDDLAISESGEAFVVSGDSVVGTPTSYESKTGVDADGNVRLVTVDELGVSALTENAPGEVFRVDADGQRELVLHRPFPAGQGLDWSVVIRAPESSFLGAIEQQQQMTLIIGVGGGLLVLLAALLLIWATRPLPAPETPDTPDTPDSGAGAAPVDADDMSEPDLHVV